MLIRCARARAPALARALCTQPAESAEWSPTGRHAAVTGGGSGIGRALSVALAERGARSVAVLDVDRRAAEDTAAAAVALAPGCEVRAVWCDATKEDSLRAALLGGHPIDVFCANAGIAAVGDCTAAEAEWERSWQMNVMQTVWAARLLVPAMRRAAGGGAFVVTASAAGLLTQLGSAPYAVTKHAAVALAEWLAITHADDGVRVVCCCPQAVMTPMAEAILAGSDPLQQLLAHVASADGVIMPEQVAAEALDCLADGTFLCMPGADAGPAKHLARKAANPERWVCTMRKLNRRLLGELETRPPPRAGGPDRR